MGLPKVSLPRAEVVVGGDKVLVRGLSRSEVHQLGKHQDDFEAAEALTLSFGCGVSVDEAKAWIADTPADAVGVVLDKVLDLSGLKDGQGND